MSHENARQLLLARRAELTGELQQIERDLDEPMPQDWEDRSSERQSDEVLQALGSHDLRELKAIDAALRRLDDGTYGMCVNCGDAISEERLRAVPTAALCRGCA